MPHVPKPRYYASRDSWYVQLDGKKYRLAEGAAAEQEAYAAFERLLDRRKAAERGDDNPVGVVLNAFLDHVQRHYASHTYQDYRRVLALFGALFGRTKIADLKPFHVERWVASEPNWRSESTIWHVKTILLAALNWAASPVVRLTAANPLAGLPKNAAVSSRGADVVIDPNEHAQMLAGASPALRDVLFALEQTGCRPIDVCRVTTHEFRPEQGVWLFARHKTAKKTGRPRVVYLTRELIELCRRLALKYPEGPLFRTTTGRSWTSSNIAAAVVGLRRRLRLKGRYIAYGHRHTMATELLERGEPDAYVAAVLGHTNTAMVHHHYSHLGENVKLLRNVVERRANNRSAAQS